MIWDIIRLIFAFLVLVAIILVIFIPWLRMQNRIGDDPYFTDEHRGM